MPAFSDHFGAAAASYAGYRPHYPAALFEWLAAASPRHDRVWDCGTGSGQAAVALASHFAEVIASDPSVAQLTNAERTEQVAYVAMTAEQCALHGGSVDLVTVAQALHWFDHRRFFAEVDRVLRPGGSLVVWSYGLLTIAPALDAELGRLYGDVLGPYWPSARALVDSGYAGIALPYPEVAPPPQTMEVMWTLPQLEGYLSTWSAVGRHRSIAGTDPLPDFMRRLAPLWGTAATRRVRWPLVVRAARKGV
jgi:SAM-dependent methyltransferase